MFPEEIKEDAKSLKQERAWHVWERARRPVWPEQSEQE